MNFSRIKNFFSQHENEHSFIVRKSFLALVVRFGSFIATYLLILVVARLYGASTLGSYSLCYAILQFCVILSLFGLDNLFVRTVAKNKAQENLPVVKTSYIQSLSIVSVFGIIISALLFALAPLICETVLNKPSLTAHLRMASLAVLPFSFINLNAAGFRGKKNMMGFNIFKLMVPLVTAMLVAVLFYQGLKWHPVKCFVLSVILVCITSFYSWNRFSGLPEVNSGPAVSWISLLSQSYPMLMTGSVFFILGWMDNLLIGYFMTEKDVGIYDTAFKIAAASAVILMAVNAIQAPVFAEQYHEGKLENLKQNVQSSTRLLFYTTLPVTLVLCLFPGFVLSFFGNEFPEAGTALAILAIGSFVNCISGSVGILLQMTGRQKQYNVIVTMAALMNLALNFWLIPVMGIAGAAVASASSKLFQNFASVWLVKREFGFITISFPFLSVFKKQ